MSYKNAKKVKKCHTEIKKGKKCHTKKCHTKNVTQKRLKNVIQSCIFLLLRQKSINPSRKFLKKVDKKITELVKIFQFRSIEITQYGYINIRVFKILKI